MRSTLTNFKLEMDCSMWKTLHMEMDFPKHRTLQLDCVAMDFSREVTRISLEWVNATAREITDTLMMSLMSIGICPITILREVSLQIHVRDDMLLMRGIQSFSHTVVIIPSASPKWQDQILERMISLLRELHRPQRSHGPVGNEWAATTNHASCDKKSRQGVCGRADGISSAIYH